MHLKISLFCLMIFLLSMPVLAQENPQDPIERHTFPPELVMQHQRAIGLTEQQETAIKKEIQQAQSRFNDLEWDLQGEMETLISSLSQEHIDEQKTLSTLAKVLKLESDIKHTHLILVIRIKNVLTPDQQQQLRKLQQRERKG